MSSSKKLLQAAAGSAGGEALNVEDVFSTYVYEGTNTADTDTQQIVNGLDLSTEGGLVWIKGRDFASYSSLVDSERGSQSDLSSADASEEGDVSATSRSVTFNTDGFTISGSYLYYGYTGLNNSDFVSWSFRKAPKFFDIVTYTGNGTAGHTISHNLGSVPGCIMIKRIDNASDWGVYHRAMHLTTPEDYYMELNTTEGRADDVQYWNDTAPTSSTFTVGTANSVNANNEPYVAYLFAHNDGDGDFGPTGDQDIIKCGSYTGTGAKLDINLGFEAQWVMVKRTDTSGYDWHMFDVMRGMPVGSDAYWLEANTSNPEANNAYMSAHPTGFTLPDGHPEVCANGGTYIYIAIRRGPMAVPESATDVFDINTYSGNGSDPRVLTSNITPDLLINASRNKAGNVSLVFDRMRGSKGLYTENTQAEGTWAQWQFDYNDAYQVGTPRNDIGEDYVDWLWKRAPSFFDVVAYTGNGTSSTTLNHNLGVVPEMIWVKCRDSTTDGASSIAANWWVGVKPSDGGGAYIFSPGLNTSDSALTSSGSWTDNTDTHFKPFSVSLRSGSEGPSGMVSNKKYIAYLFASLDGVSKVFSVTKSSGSDASVNCGFSAGPRFVLLKRTDSTGDWYVWDSERGIVSGNDPYLLLNSTAAEVTSTDYIDPTSNGFTIVNGGLADGDYIGYAVA